MKKTLVIFCFIIYFFCSYSFGNANVTAYFMYSTFNILGEKGPYVETYLSVIGSTVKFNKNTNNRYQGVVEIKIGFKQNGEIKYANKYTLNSPETVDTIKNFPNFIDQQRYSLPNGDYEIEITITDIGNLKGAPFTNTVPLKINFPDNTVSISNIEFLESYTKSINPTTLTKSGYELIPYIANFYPENVSKLKFYVETYNVKKGLGENEKIVITYFIESYESKTKLNEYASFQKQTANDVNIVLTEFNIEKLPTGNYNMVVEVRDKENKIQAEQRSFFQRKNVFAELSFADLKAIDVAKTFVSFYKNIDSLRDYISSIRPISSSTEVQYAETQLKGKNVEATQQFFYNFWKSRDALDPELAWLNYYKQVMKVNKEFTTYGLKGYDTERGRVYLQYGPPDIRNKVDNELGAYPYEIWQYFTLTDKTLIITNPNNKQSNKRFVFYNPDLVTNKYYLIHSDARGEVYNTRWEILIYNRDSQNPNNDVEKIPDRFGNGTNQNYNDPK